MRIMIVDDDAFIVESLTTILSAQPDITVAETALSGHEALRLYERATPDMRPDVVLMDIRMPNGDGLWAAERILGVHQQARIVFLTTFADDDYIVRALRLGACGYLIKQDVASLAPALRSVMAGQIVLENEVVERMATLGTAAQADKATQAEKTGDAHGANAAGAADAAGAANAADTACKAAQAEEVGTPSAQIANAGTLTEREQRIVELVAQGCDNKQIAATVYVSEGTVRNHISSILSKLALKNRTQIAVHYWKSRAESGRNTATRPK